MSRIHLILAFISLISVPAFASISDQEILLSSVSEDASNEKQTTAQVDASLENGARRFSIGLGSGVNSFGGNMGKLYDTSGAVLDLRGQWAYHRLWGVKLGGELAKYGFTAAPNGPVRVSTQSLSVASQLHFLSTALASEGFDPYLSFQGQWISRSQDFEAFNSVENDSAFGLGAGIGSNFLFSGGKLGLWMEASANSIQFRDRFQQEYLDAGIEDTTGPMYSGRVGMKYVF